MRCDQLRCSSPAFTCTCTYKCSVHLVTRECVRRAKCPIPWRTSVSSRASGTGTSGRRSRLSGTNPTSTSAMSAYASVPPHQNRSFEGRAGRAPEATAGGSGTSFSITAWPSIGLAGHAQSRQQHCHCHIGAVFPVRAHPIASCTVLNSRQHFEVFLALCCPLLIARLVLRANQTMRTTPAKRREIEVATTIANTMLQMRAVRLCGAVSPGRACRIGEETVELAAMTT